MLVYCRVKGKNPIHPAARVIVTNVVVSFVSAASNSFPVVIFPPGPIFSKKELQQLIGLNDSYDVIKIHTFEFPPEKKEENYIKERIEHLNKCVMEYVELCQQHLEGRLEKRINARLLLDPGITTIEEEKTVVDEKSALDFLDVWASAEVNEKKGKHERHQNQLVNVIQYLKKNSPQYDVEKFEKAIDLQGSDNKLIQLYIQKYKAVFDERYETAAEIKDQIDRLENSFIRNAQFRS